MKTLTTTLNGWTATYSGGPYIDIHVFDQIVDNINVLDYATGECTMEPTQQALTHELREWLVRNSASLNGYIEHAIHM